MLSSRSRSMATHPIPPSLIATLMPRNPAGSPDHSPSAQADNDRWPHRRAPLGIGGSGEDPTAEPGDLGGEVERRPDPVDVHVPDALVDVPAARPHVLEPGRLESDRFGSPAGHRVHPHLGVALAVELPELV